MSDMKGIRTYFRRWRETGFKQSYHCLYPLFGGMYFYLLDGDCVFHFPWDNDEPSERFLKSAVANDASGRLFPVSALTQNDVYVTDDWNGFVLTNSMDLSTNQIISKSVTSLTSVPVQKDLRVVFFHNYDGAFWQFFSNDDAFAAKMTATHHENPDLDLRVVDYACDYPDPGRYRDDYPPRA